MSASLSRDCMHHVAPAWLSTMIAAATAIGHHDTEDGYLQLAMNLRPFIERAADQSARKVEAITRNYLRDHNVVEGLQQTSDDPRFQAANTSVWTWISNYIEKWTKDNPAEAARMAEAEIDVNAWCDLFNHLASYNYEASLRMFVGTLVARRWQRFLRDQAAKQRGGEGVQSRAVRDQLKQEGVLPTRRRDNQISLDEHIAGRTVEAWIASFDQSVETIVEQREGARLLCLAFRYLSDKHESGQPCALLIARYWNDHTLAEIGSTFQLPTNRVWRMIAQYQREMREWLMQQGYTP